MKLSDLQSKDIVSLKDGRRIGRIIDIDFDFSTGVINTMLIEPKRTFRNFGGLGADTTIKFNQISKIGEDVILVDF